MAMKYTLKLRNNHDRLLFQEKHSDGSDNENEIPLLQKTKKDKTPMMDIEVEPGETLQAIAIRFHCTIAELKRINNILRENEIYARRTIKVPVRPHSILTEKIIGVHISGSNSPIRTSQTSLIDIDTETLEEKLKSTSVSASINSNCDNKPSDLHVLKDIIFNSATTPISNVVSDEDDTEADENVNLLLPKVPVVALNEKISFRGDDCGLSWLVLVVFVLVIGFVCPLIYILYIAEHPEKYHHH